MDKEYWERRKFLEFCFKNETKIIKAIWEKRLDPNIPKSYGHGSGISKPTENIAIKNIMPLDFVNVENTTIYNPELWIHLIVRVKSYYCYKQGGLLYFFHYFKQYRRAETMKSMNISKTRYHQLIVEMIDFAMRKAEAMELKYGTVGVISKKEY